MCFRNTGSLSTLCGSPESCGAGFHSQESAKMKFHRQESVTSNDNKIPGDMGASQPRPPRPSDFALAPKVEKQNSIIVSKQFKHKNKIHSLFLKNKRNFKQTSKTLFEQSFEVRQDCFDSTSADKPARFFCSLDGCGSTLQLTFSHRNSDWVWDKTTQARASADAHVSPHEPADPLQASRHWFSGRDRLLLVVQHGPRSRCVVPLTPCSENRQPTQKWKKPFNVEITQVAPGSRTTVVRTRCDVSSNASALSPRRRGQGRLRTSWSAPPYPQRTQTGRQRNHRRASQSGRRTIEVPQTGDGQTQPRPHLTFKKIILKQIKGKEEPAIVCEP